MQGDEAIRLLGFSPNSRPTTSQVKAAYRRKAMESHPDLFPPHEKSQAEAKFKLISEAYSSLRAGTRSGSPVGGTSVRVVRTGVPSGYRRSNPVLLKAPFLLIILGTVSLGGLNAMRAYQRHIPLSIHFFHERTMFVKLFIGNYNRKINAYRCRIEVV